jgi:hypothetical protein
MPSTDRVAPKSAHTFHIPVMGTGFTIDTPLRVARYGISSVISLVDDVLIEQMRKLHCERAGEPYEPITNACPDARARRISEYLNLLGRLVERQVEELQAAPFVPGSEITRYFELLPDSTLRQAYLDMLATTDAAERTRLQDALRPQAVPGSIDVNMLTKLIGDKYRNGVKLPPEHNDAASAVRGYALSDLHSSIIFSAGLNPPLYAYLADFPDFLPDAQGVLKKRIVLKVSDYRSAEVQGRFLAKRGLWVSEYRIESGLNCGGHAFPGTGHLLGPVMEEFREKRAALLDDLHHVLCRALQAKELPVPEAPYAVRFTVQGGIGTHAENELLLQYYEMDATGWGTPFLLVPEATNMDCEHRRLLIEAGEEDVYLSDASPLCIPFWNLRQSASERQRRARIMAGHPGSPCIKGYAAWNTEFSPEPICTASASYQQRKLQELEDSGLEDEELAQAQAAVIVKSCICHDLAGNATLLHGIDEQAKASVCCGPGIIHFTRLASLEEMIGHIYGRLNLLNAPNRQHMFITELKLHVDYLRRELEKIPGALADPPKHLREFQENLLKGIDYYRNVARQIMREHSERFLCDLNALREHLEQLHLAVAAR